MTVKVGADMKKPIQAESASAFIDEKIKELADWRGKTLRSCPPAHP
jgi:hypothetical protein